MLLVNIYYGIFYELCLNFCLFWPIMQIRKKGVWNLKKFFSSETTEPISTKLCWNDPWHLKKFLFLVMAAILDTRRYWRTQIWKGTTQGSFQQSLVEIGSVFSEEIFFKFHPPFSLFLAWWCSIRTKFWWNSHRMVLFQKCVRRFSPLIKMASTAELSLT
jgi:hypothetical protein